MLTHLPLPYVVRIRLVSSEDTVPDVRELHVVAYSVFEAMLQGLFEAGATGIGRRQGEGRARGAGRPGV